MNLRAAIARWLLRDLQPEARSLSPAAWLRGYDNAEAGGASLANAYTQSVWVYSCVNAISRMVSQASFVISREGRRSRKGTITEGPVVDLFRLPHPQLNRFQFWELVCTWLSLRGEAFIVPLNSLGETVPLPAAGATGRGTSIRQLLVLSPDQMRSVVQGNTLVGWIYTANGNEDPFASATLLPEEVVHVRLPNPFDFWRGLSPLSVARLAASTDYAAAMFHRGLMLNNGDVGIVITSDQQFSDEQIAALSARLRERKRKAGTADRPIFLGGGARMEKPQLTSADLQYLENRKFNRQEICSVYGVPQEILGWTEDANRSVSDNARLNFIENTCIPIGDRIEAAVEVIVRVFGPELFGWFNWSELPIMQTAQRALVDTAVKYWTMGVPFNDINDALDLGFKAYPWHATGYLPFSVQPAASVGEPPDMPAEPDANPDPDADPQDPADKAIALLESACCRAPIPRDQWERSIAGSFKLKKGRVQRYLWEQRAAVIAALQAANPAPGAAAVRAFPEDIFNLTAENQKLLDRLKPLLIADLEFGGAQLWREIGLVDFKLPPLRAVEYLAGRENKITSINAATFEDLRATLQEGLLQGDTTEQLVDRVRTVYSGSAARAETIALTETAAAVNGGRFTGMKTAGVQRKGWRTSNLANTRMTHIQAEKDYVAGIPIDQAFRVGDSYIQYPGDPAGQPGETINCRCFTYAIVDAKSAIPTRFLAWEEWLQASGKRLEAPENAPDDRTPTNTHPNP